MPITLAHADDSRLDWQPHARTLRQPYVSTEPSGVVPDSAARDAAFVALQAALRSHGGIARGDSLATCLGRAGRGGYVDLARRLVAGDLFSFRWHDAFWVPLFQFDPVRLTLRAAPRRVLDELQGVLGGWDIAIWYVRAHQDLRGQRPLDLLDTDLAAVLAAARVTRRAAKP